MRISSSLLARQPTELLRFRNAKLRTQTITTHKPASVYDSLATLLRGRIRLQTDVIILPHRVNAACSRGIAPSSELKRDLARTEFAPARLLPDGIAAHRSVASRAVRLCLQAN
jgi:hypothetical protein